MLPDVFSCEGLTKSYRNFKALDEIDLTLKSGHIYGLVGNNGAGKTTLMRLMMGLTFPTGGKFTLFGKSTPRELATVRNQIGAIIETPIYNGNMSGRCNLEVLRSLYGMEKPNVVNEALERMDLLIKGDILVGKYSLGMRQRLALAGALMGTPDFLVLDEPLNGLDPSGIREIREILQSFHAEHKTTMLISSHYLEQLNLLATDYVLLHHGKIIKQFTQEELAQNCKSYIALEVDDVAAALDVLKEKFPNLNVVVTREQEIRIYNFDEKPQRINGVLALKKIFIGRLETVGTTFEEYFTALIGSEKS